MISIKRILPHSAKGRAGYQWEISPGESEIRLKPGEIIGATYLHGIEDPVHVIERLKAHPECILTVEAHSNALIREKLQEVMHRAGASLIEIIGNGEEDDPIWEASKAAQDLGLPCAALLKEGGRIEDPASLSYRLKEARLRCWIPDLSSEEARMTAVVIKELGGGLQLGEKPPNAPRARRKGKGETESRTRKSQESPQSPKGPSASEILKARKR